MNQLQRKHTNIDAKIYSNSVAKFKEYCAENNMKIKVKVKNNCTKYSDFPNTSIKFQ